MGNDSELSIVVRARNEASKVLDQVRNDASGIGGHISKSFKDAVPASAALGAAVAGAGLAVVAFGKSSLDAYKEAQEAVAQLDAVIKSTGGAAGVTSVELQKQATALQSVTKFSDEAVMATQSMLLTFTNIKGGVMKDATKTALDMAQALGMDGKQAALQLGKALNDPAEGLSKLTRVGVTFTKAQEDQVKAMVAAGDTAGAQKVILQELQKEFGGSAEAAGNTFAGKLEILKNTFGDLQEGIGELIVGALTPLATAFSGWLSKVSEAGGLLAYFKKVIQDNQDVIAPLAMAIAVALVPALVAAAAAAWSFISPLIPFLAIGAALGLLLNQLAKKMGGWSKVLEEAKRIIGEVKVGFGAMIQAFKDPDVTSDGFVGVMERIGSTARSVFDFLLSTGKAVWAGIQQAIQFLLPSLEALWNAIATRLWPALVNLYNTLAPILMPILKVLAIVIGVVLVGAFWVIINVINVVISVVSWFSNVLMGIINVVAGVVGAIINYFQMLYNFWQPIFSAYLNVVIFVFQMIGVVVATAISLIMAVVSPIASFIGNVFQSAWNWVRGIWQGVAGWFGGIVGGIANALGGVFNAITSPFQRAFDFVRTIPGKIVDSIGNIGNMLRDKIGNWDIPGPLGKVRDVIPGFATGVRNFTGGAAIVGERGPELVTLPRGSNVFTNDQTERMVGGTTNNFYGTIQIQTPEAANAFFDRLNRDAEMANFGVPI